MAMRPPTQYADVKKYREQLDNAKDEMKAVVRAATPAVNRYARDCIRKRVPPGNTSTSGMSNPFPGYRASGSLKSAIVAGPVREEGQGYTAACGIGVNASKRVRMLAAVHEYGLVITAKNKPYLKYRIGDGTWRQTKRVRIKAKRFFRSGFAEARAKFPEIVGDIVRQRWPGKPGAAAAAALLARREETADDPLLT